MRGEAYSTDFLLSSAAFDSLCPKMHRWGIFKDDLLDFRLEIWGIQLLCKVPTKLKCREAAPQKKSSSHSCFSATACQNILCRVKYVNSPSPAYFPNSFFFLHNPENFLILNHSAFIPAFIFPALTFHPPRCPFDSVLQPAMAPQFTLTCDLLLRSNITLFCLSNLPLDWGLFPKIPSQSWRGSLTSLPWCCALRPIVGNI